jgi:hypothetical protein
MRHRIVWTLLTGIVCHAFPLRSHAQLVVIDPSNLATNMANLTSQVSSWTSSLANEARGLGQGMTQIQQYYQQIQQYRQMLTYLGDPKQLANAVGLGPVMNLEGQLQSLYGQFSNVRDLSSLTSATGSMANTMNGLYPAVNPNNILNAQAFQKFDLISKAGDQYQKVLSANNQYQQQLATQLKAEVSSLQNAQNQTEILRAQGAIAATQAAQQQSQSAVANAGAAQMAAAAEEQALNDQADEAAYQEALKVYEANEETLNNAAISSLNAFGSTRPTVSGTATAVAGQGYQLQGLGIQ